MRQFRPGAERTKRPLGQILAAVLPPEGLVLELASGSGQEIAWWAETMPRLRWVPSDVDARARESIEAWRSSANVATPLALDATRAPWPLDRAEAIVAHRLLHLLTAAGRATLFAEAARILSPDGVVVLAGQIGGASPPPPAAGLADWTVAIDVPDLDELRGHARAAGLKEREIRELFGETVLVYGASPRSSARAVSRNRG